MTFRSVRRRFLHRVKGVNQQIENNLLQLHSVTAHTRQAILAFELDANIAKIPSLWTN